MQHRVKNKNETLMLGDCAVCGPQVPLSNKAGSLVCKTARDSFRRGKYKGNNYISWGNLHPSVKMKMWLNQGKKCALCDREITFEEARLDHDHKTLVHRGVLCNTCNLTLGHVETKPVEWLLRAATYLKERNAKGKDSSSRTTPTWTGQEFIVVGGNKLR